MKKLICAALGMAVAAFVQPASAKTVLAYTFGPSATLPNVQGLKRVLGGIEKATDGTLKFRLRLAGSLPIKSTNITQAVGDGTIAFADDGLFLGNVPIAGLLRLPLLLRTREDYRKAAAIMDPYIRKGFEKQGVVVLGHFLFPHQVLFSTKKSTDLKDIAGQKVRVSSPEQAAFISKFGGQPVTMGAPEVPPGLQRGTIDGVLTASAGGGKIWGDMLKYNYRMPINYFDGVYIMNAQVFNGLDAATQKKVRDAVQTLAPKTTDGIFSEEASVTAKLKKNGMVVVTPDADAIKRATDTISPFWEQWAKEHGPDAVEALAKVRKALGR